MVNHEPVVLKNINGNKKFKCSSLCIAEAVYQLIKTISSESLDVTVIL